MKALYVAGIPDKVHKEFKIKCQRNDLTIGEVIKNYMYRITGLDKNEVQEITK